MNWLLPEYIADALPAEAAKLEALRRRLLDLFARHGYELVMPPLLEYLDSLLTGTAEDLELKTFQLADQISGRTLGVRADMTPQVARIDAHLLNRAGLARLCYCGSVLHTLPASKVASREPLQVGAELYGYGGIEADIEVVRLLASALQACGLTGSRIDLGHVGIFQALAEAVGLDAAREDALLTLMQSKDVPGLAEACADIEAPYRAALLALPTLYGGGEVLQRAAEVLPPLPAITKALEGLSRIVAAAPELSLSIDLADLRGYHYHNGVVFAAYHSRYPAAIARGGRYDGAGKAFGRARPATGFSFDLREVAGLSPVEVRPQAIVAPYAGDNGKLAEEIARLRAAGEVVVELLPGEAVPEGPNCTRRLRPAGCQWIIDQL
ncbi:MAG: ATP phosphoribosyltransferase regulatory subunit [Betaproteobacteria bacterium ADurb.Bin341]|nr:MAG: ATP phosphoribosyltransferase regulatory subunit [Betaproteobacteria bacterium ADurb.Bin341]